jgi:hypothetical protein
MIGSIGKERLVKMVKFRFYMRFYKIKKMNVNI